MPKIASKSRECAQAIGRRENVTTYGALRAENVNGLNVWDSGRLSGEDLEAFRMQRLGITYVVYSYNTPIAWVLKDGTVHRVTQKFSVTTTQHQGKLYLLDES
jgi:hypothetical protein